MKNEKYIIESVDKAFSLLIEVARSPRSNLTNLAEKAKLNKSRAYRLLYTMEQRKVIKKEENNTYSLGDTMLILGITASAQLDLIRLATPIMEDLCQRVNETVQLRTVDHLDALCIAKTEPSRDLRVHANIGRRRPLYTGSPKCLLAYQSQEFIDRCIPDYPPPLTDHTPRTRDEVLQALASIRQQGYCVSRGEVDTHQIACSAPVFSFNNAIVATIHVVAPKFRVGESELEHMIRQVTSAAERLSAELGR